MSSIRAGEALAANDTPIHQWRRWIRRQHPCTNQFPQQNRDKDIHLPHKLASGCASYFGVMVTDEVKNMTGTAEERCSLGVRFPTADGVFS